MVTKSAKQHKGRSRPCRSGPLLFLSTILVHSLFNPIRDGSSLFLKFFQAIVILIVAGPLSEPEQFLSIFTSMLQPVRP